MRRSMTWIEQRDWQARQRLEADHEHHTMAKLPCCGSAVEIVDPSKDNFVTCPNPACRKRHVVLSGLSHRIESEQSNEPTHNLHW
jgi:hypothetical protein